MRIAPEQGGAWETAVVRDVTERLVAVTAPKAYRGRAGMARGQRWTVRYFDELGEYRFGAPVLQVEGPPAFLAWLELPARIEEIQRRSHVRLVVNLPVRLWEDAAKDARAPEPQPAGPAAGRPPADGRRVAAGETVDLSAGGVQVRLSGPPPVASVYGIEIGLPDGVVTLRTRLVRVVERALPDGRVQRAYGFTFVDPEAGLQDRIVRFIFAEQR
ncbi:MAG TPA: PilZ domain-containing protein, partial [Bacillota bacterium]